MKHIGRLMLFTLFLPVFAMVLSHSAIAAPHPPPPPPPPPTIPVKVENTPLPVSGSVNAAVTGTVGISGTPNVNVVNTPSVNATQSGPWSVSITGMPSVSLSTTTPLTVTSASDPSSSTFTPVSGARMALSHPVPAKQAHRRLLFRVDSCSSSKMWVPVRSWAQVKSSLLFPSTPQLRRG